MVFLGGSSSEEERLTVNQEVEIS